jgi:hypothetical protein
MMTNCVYKNINGFKIDKPQFVINKNVNLHKIKGTMGQFGPMVLKYMINFHNKNQTNVLVKDNYIH